MTQPVDIDLNLDGNYVSQVGAATEATQGLSQAVQAVSMQQGPMQRALGAITPSRAHIVAWGGFTAAAAYFQQEVSGIRATASAAGQSARGLESDVRRLASTFPIGAQGAVQLVQAVQGLGARQRDILPLAQNFERLAAATGSFGPSITQNFGQLNREMASLDPARISRFSDVLTTLSAKSGASAEGIVSFAQSIAPMAQQAGIGETSVLGISSAFVKLGADGGSAATAVSKILGDLNRSVREGSNDMAAYAQMTGMTVQQFRALYQANPTQALTSVTRAIGQAGPQGQMMLESIGLEGVRTQRALLQLSQSGGLGQAITQAQNSYGSGSTAAAAAQAFGGLNDSLTELRSTAGQVADALGAPFLRPLTQIVNLAKSVTSPVASVLGSGYAQHMIGGVATLAIGGMVARRLVHPLGMGALGLQAATSGPVRSISGGWAYGRQGGDYEAAMGMRSGRFGGEPLSSQMMLAPYGRGFMQGINRRALQAGEFLGRTYSETFGLPAAPGRGGGPGMIGALARAGRAGLTTSTMAAQAYINSIADPYVQAGKGAGDRQSLLTPRSGQLLDRAGTARTATMNAMRRQQEAFASYEQNMPGASAGGGWLARQTRGLQASLGVIEKEGGSFSAAISRMTSATIGATRAVGTFAGRTAEAGIAAGMGGLQRAGGGLLQAVGGPVGAAMLAGFGGYSLYRGIQSRNAQNADDMRNTDIYGVQNSWRDAMGEASQAATTMADAMAAASNTINAAVTNLPSATHVSNADITAAGHFNAKDQQKNAVLRYAGSPTAMAALVQAGALTGMTPQDLQGVKMQMIKQGIDPATIDATLGAVQAGGTDGRITHSTVQGLVSAYGTAVASYNRAGHGLTDIDSYAGRDAKKVAQDIAGALGQQQTNLQGRFGGQYATQQTLRSLQDIINSTPATGKNGEISQQRYTLTHQLAASLGYTGQGGAANLQDLLGMKGVSIGGMSGQQLLALVNGPSIAPVLQPSIMEAPLRGAGANALLPFFSSQTATGPYGAGQRAATYLAAGHEQDVSAQTAAVTAIVNGAVAAGTSLDDLAEQATKASSSTADWQQALMVAIAEEANFRRQLSLQGANRATTFAVNTAADLRTIAAGPGTDPNGFQAKQYTQAKQDLASQRGALIDYYQQRVMAQYQFQIQSERAQEDYQKQVTRGEQDFYKGRYRATRDFNKQMTREAEDAAKQMYNPYTRIAVQPVWDAGNLQMNRSEQLSALRQQFANINKLRNMGLSERTIQQLSLYDPNNAQQTAELVADLNGNKGLIKQYNSTSVATQAAANALLSKSPEYKRQRADFQQSLRDQNADFKTAQKRAETDFQTSMSRMAQDLHTQDLAITNNMTTLQNDMNKILHGQSVSFAGQLDDTLSGMLKAAKTYAPQINDTLNGIGPNSNIGSGFQDSAPATSGRKWTGTPTGHFSSPGGLHRATGPSVNQGFLLSKVSRPGTDTNSMGNPNLHWGHDVLVAPDNKKLTGNRKLAQQLARHYGWSDGPEWAALYQIWEQESQFSTTANNGTYGGIPQGPWKTLKGKSATQQINWGLDYISGRYGDPLGAWAHKSRTGWYGDGGIFVGPHTIGVGERGPEMVLPLNEHGANLIAAAMKTYVGVSDAKTLSTGGMATATHIDHSQHYYDNRNDFGGATFHVQANDPAELARESAARARRDALTAPRGVAWQPTSR